MSISLRQHDRLIILAVAVTVTFASVAAFLENLVFSLGMIFFLGFLVVFPLGFTRDRKARRLAAESDTARTDLGGGPWVGGAGLITLVVGIVLAVAATIRGSTAAAYGGGRGLRFATALLILGGGMIWGGFRASRSCRPSPGQSPGQ
ncbi:hypothetical protein [Corynebacterium sp.]|uniref:hypothetical protein n=1 Tax=Corynebacterium sp. TaxID=1720 RepID=UPI002649A0CA|nr:hypothetical protein [Corynebacterium sp.]MDN6374555.1 hypothetical protein [Corynebacterium sp.]